MIICSTGKHLVRIKLAENPKVRFTPRRFKLMIRLEAKTSEIIILG